MKIKSLMNCRKCNYMEVKDIDIKVDTAYCPNCKIYLSFVNSAWSDKYHMGTTTGLLKYGVIYKGNTRIGRIGLWCRGKVKNLLVYLKLIYASIARNPFIYRYKHLI